MGSIRSVKAQYFLAFAPLGSVGPLLPIFLKQDKGFSHSQFGTLIALTALSMVVTPVVLALLADTKFDSRRLLAGTYLVCGAMLIGMYFAQGVVLVSLLYMVYTLALMPGFPLLDGLYFSLERTAQREGRIVSAYQFVRLWGTIGFIAPSLLLYYALVGGGVGIITWVAAGCYLIGAANCVLLPRASVAGSPVPRVKATLPTADALRALFGPGTRVFCLAMFLAFMSAVTYYNLFPHYLKEIAGVRENLIPLVMGIGVLLEIIYMLGLGWLRERLRLKGVLVLGIFAMSLRMALLSTFPSVWTAVAVQVLHGMEALALYVVPVMYIDRLAGDRFRSSIQGAYMMTVLASSRAAGAFAAGVIGERSVIVAFQCAAGVSFVSFLILAVVFRPVPVSD